MEKYIVYSHSAKHSSKTIKSKHTNGMHYNRWFMSKSAARRFVGTLRKEGHGAVIEIRYQGRRPGTPVFFTFDAIKGLP